jgi:lipoprotein-releasing system permease protein
MSAQILANTLIRIFVGITVALGIASVLVVSVVQKSKEIGILRAMGTAAPRYCVSSCIQGGFMGLTGRCSARLLAWGFLLLWRGVATNPDGSPLFVVVIEPRSSRSRVSARWASAPFPPSCPRVAPPASIPAVAIRG